MAVRYTRIVSLLIILGMFIGACGDPRPISHLAAPTPIPPRVEPTATLNPTLEASLQAVETVSPTSGEGEQVLPIPEQQPDAHQGATVFAQNCAVCHGEDGTGVIPDTPDFTQPDLFRGAAPAELFISVSKGKGTMPPWESSLNEQQRWDAVFYTLDFAVDNQILKQGKDIYTTNCVVCHGQDGKGLLEDTPDMTSPEFVATTRLVDLFTSVSKGKGTMPPWEAQLSEEERWAVLMYIRTFGYKSLHRP